MYYNDEQLHKEIKNLPEKLQEFVKSLDIADIISNIGLEQDLLISEIGYIYEETKKVIVGETRPESFVDNVRTKLGDENKEKATPVATEINNKILIPIREAFKRISMGNLVPNPAEERSAFSVQRSDENGTIENQPSQATRSTLDANRYQTEETEVFDRNALMREIENPTPTEVLTYDLKPIRRDVSESDLNKQEPIQTLRDESERQNTPPENLPVKKDEKAEQDFGSGAILRTMPRDMMAKTTNQQPTRQTFEEKKLSGQATYDQPAKILPGQNLGGQASYSRGKFGHGTPPLLRQDFAGQVPSFPPSPNAKEGQSKQQFPRQTFENRQEQKLSGQETSSGATSYMLHNTSSSSFIPRQAGVIGGTIRGEEIKNNGESQKKETEKPYSSTSPLPPKPTTGRAETPISKQQFPNNNQNQKTETRKPNQLNAEPQYESKTPYGAQRSTLNASFPIPNAPTSTPQTEPQKTTFQIPQDNAQTPNKKYDEQSPTKTIGVPSEKKRYVVDPYRESMEE